MSQPRAGRVVGIGVPGEPDISGIVHNGHSRRFGHLGHVRRVRHAPVAGGAPDGGRQPILAPTNFGPTNFGQPIQDGWTNHMDDLDIEHIDRMGDNALNVVVVIPMVLDTDLVQDEHGAKLTEDEAVDLLREHLQQNVPGLTGDLAAVGPVSVGPGVGDGVFIPPAHLQAIWNDMRSLYAAYTQSVANPPAVQAMGAALSWMAWPYSELLGIPMADVQKCLEAGQSEPPLLRPLASST